MRIENYSAIKLPSSLPIYLPIYYTVADLRHSLCYSGTLGNKLNNSFPSISAANTSSYRHGHKSLLYPMHPIQKELFLLLEHKCILVCLFTQ